MSWWVYLQGRHGLNVSVERHTEGGTYVLGGITEAELNVTYNYSGFYHEHLDREEGLRWLDKRKAKECIPRLEAAVTALGVDRDSDYWAPTVGNAGYALSILLDWAKQHPRARFVVD